MAKICELTGKGPTTGNLVSHSNIKTRTRWLPNMLRKKYTIPELSQTLTLRLCTHAVKTIDKQGGITRALLQAKDENLSDRLKSVKLRLKKKLRASTPKAAAATTAAKK